jgi:hypothetical protein
MPPFFTYPNRPWNPGDFPPEWGWNSTNFPIGSTSTGGTSSFGGFPLNSDPAGDNPGGNGGPSVPNQDYFIYAPKRTRWFSNILKARQQAQGRFGNPYRTNSGSDGAANPPNQ